VSDHDHPRCQPDDVRCADFDIFQHDIVEGDSGLIVIDTLGSPETADAALDLYYQHRPRKPVGTVIYTHSHPIISVE